MREMLSIDHCLRVLNDEFPDEPPYTREEAGQLRDFLYLVAEAQLSHLRKAGNDADAETPEKYRKAS